jgi:hypothetical protein
MDKASRCYEKVKDDFSYKATEDQIKLLLIQKDLEAEYNDKFVELSLAETLEKLIVLGQMKRASKIRSDFKVSDKKYWWIAVKAMAIAKDWEGLERFGRDKSPVGYLPFVEVCVDFDRQKEAVEIYLPKIKDPLERIEALCKLQFWEQAVEVARAMKDPSHAIYMIRRRCTNKEISNKLAE